MSSEIQLSEEKKLLPLYPVDGTEVAPLIDKALLSITEMSETFKVWNRSHSDLTWNAMVLDEESETRNLRQISAEIKRKRDALTESHFAYKKNMQKAKIYDAKAKRENDELEAEMYDLEASEQRAYAQMKHEAILGATKDIQALKASYDKIYKRILDKHGKFDEQVFELEERRYWIKRGFKQSMQDVRERGHISKGEQMLLEQIGLEPMEVLKDIKFYLNFINENIENGSTIDQATRQDFFEQMADKYENKVEKKLLPMGETEDHLYIGEVK
jgi:hypothetical protein